MIDDEAQPTQYDIKDDPHAPSDEELENMIEASRAMRAAIDEVLASKRQDILVLLNVQESYELGESRLLAEAIRRKDDRRGR